jgi:hypothetical protein
MRDNEGEMLAALSLLSPYATEILLAVRRAMQAAEEIGGPEGEDYLRLMRAIRTDAGMRFENYTNTMMESRQ